MQKTLFTLLSLGALTACSAPGPLATSTFGDGSRNDPFLLTVEWEPLANDGGRNCKVRDIVPGSGVASCTARSTTLPRRSECIEVKRNQWVLFQSGDSDDFFVWFSPFDKSAKKIDRRRRAMKIRNVSANGDYKYSILKDGCGGIPGAVYDPHIRVVN